MNTNNVNNTIPVNFFLSKKDIEENVVAKNAGIDTSTAYIIYQNNHIIQKINEVLIENAKLHQEKEEKEEFCDNLERTRTCLQGYVKNEFERANKYKKLYDIYAAEHSKKEKQYLHFYIYTTVYMLFLAATDIRNVMLSTMIASFVVYNMYLMVYVHSPRHSAINTNEVKELVDSIKKTEQSNIYIEDLIDNM